MCLASETCCPFKGFVKDTHFVSIHIYLIDTRSLSININTFFTSFMSHTCSKRCTQFDVCSETERKIHIRVVNVPGKRNFNINIIWTKWSKWTFSQFAVTNSTAAKYNNMAFWTSNEIPNYPQHFNRTHCDDCIFPTNVRHSIYQNFMRLDRLSNGNEHLSYYGIFMPMILLACSASYY